LKSLEEGVKARGVPNEAVLKRRLRPFASSSFDAPGTHEAGPKNPRSVRWLANASDAYCNRKIAVEIWQSALPEIFI
jgi:hypothetical protein